MLRVAIIGCGKIADQHVLAMQRIPNCKLVAVCDRELLMAEQLAERFGVDGCFGDARELLETAKPDVVHITTPPQSHFALGRQCLEFGSHVYVEKPFTVTAKEAAALIQLAEERHLKVTAGHNLQFTPEMLKMRRLIGEGFLGGKPVHLESYFSYDLGDSGYVGAFLGNPKHWVHQLPGQLFHNILSHGLAKLVEFLDDDVTEIIAITHQSPLLQKSPGLQVMDELRVVLRDITGTTAFFCFTTQIKPSLNQLRIFGPRNSLTVNHISGTVTREEAGSFKSYLTFFLPPLLAAREQLGGAFSNMTAFLGRRLYQDFGMKELIERFYNSIRTGGPPPIPYREIILTARIMDEIFAQIYPGRERVAITDQTKKQTADYADVADSTLISDLRPPSSVL
jgi:Predicted dehydrogenases and related proteins